MFLLFVSAQQARFHRSEMFPEPQEEVFNVIGISIEFQINKALIFLIDKDCIYSTFSRYWTPTVDVF